MTTTNEAVQVLLAFFARCSGGTSRSHCLDCGAFERYHACPGRPGEQNW